MNRQTLSVEGTELTCWLDDSFVRTRHFTSYNGTGSNNIIRLNSDGTVDTGFAVGTGFNWHVYTIAPAGDGSGDVYADGYFTSYDGTTSNHVARLKTNGTVN